MKQNTAKVFTSEKAFMNMILLSIFSILLSMVFLASSTWAWFTADVSTPVSSTIMTSSFRIVELTATVNDSPEAVICEKLTGNKLTEYLFYTNEEDQTAEEGTYLFTVKADGSGKGYCKIVVTVFPEDEGAEPIEEIHFTDVISTDTALSFRVTLSEAAVLRVIPIWGSYAGTNVIEVTAAAEP